MSVKTCDLGLWSLFTNQTLEPFLMQVCPVQAFSAAGLNWPGRAAAIWLVGYFIFEKI